MRIIKSLVFAMAVVAPVASYAFSNEGPAVKNLIKDHQEAILEYAEKNKKTVPIVIDYKYGMKLDVARIVRMSPELKECKVVPQLMTYEDSRGDLNTLQYKIMSGCRGKN